MELATITLALAGDDSNTIEKYEVTPSEAEVLRQIHGPDAVKNIKITGEVERRSREERARLIELYSKQQPDGTRTAPIVDRLFPGVAARLFESFDELEELDESFFAPVERQAPKKVDPLDHDEDGKKGGSKKRTAKKAKAEEQVEEPVQEPEAEGDDLPDDGIDDMDDGKDLFK